MSLTLWGDPAMQAAARSLAAQESQCCSFFTFSFSSMIDRADQVAEVGVELTVAVPEAHIGVLDGLQRLAEAAVRHRE